LLIDPRKKRVYAYRPGLLVEEIDDPETVGGEYAQSEYYVRINRGRHPRAMQIGAKIQF
jgi:hypothetical protein